MGSRLKHPVLWLSLVVSRVSSQNSRLSQRTRVQAIEREVIMGVVGCKLADCARKTIARMGFPADFILSECK